jgi:FMN phosphatase YigB (HAD superfamily)
LEKIYAITFDLWLTLIWDSKELEEYRKLRRLINFHRFVNRVGASGKVSDRINFNSIRLALEKLSVDVQEVYESGRDISPEDRGRILFQILGIKLPNPEESKRVYEQAGRILSDAGYRKKYPNLNPEAKPALKELKETYPEIKIGLISNAARSSKTYSRMLHAFGIAKYFDALTISCEVGYLKPRREIFEVSLRLLSVKPENAIHVGDLFDADVVGAINYGMNALLYTGLWHKYAQYMNPGQHLPHDFKPVRKNQLVREISSLRDIVKLVQNSHSH